MKWHKNITTGELKSGKGSLQEKCFLDACLEESRQNKKKRGREKERDGIKQRIEYCTYGQGE